jgi:Tfp pilus assembly protein PilN
VSQQINLFNPRFLAQPKYFSAAAMVQALAVVLAGIVLIYAFAVRQTAGLQRLLAEANQRAAQQREQLVALGKQYSDQGASKKLEADIAKAESQLRRRAELLGEMKTNIGSNAEGFSKYLEALARQTTQGVWLTGVELSGKSNDLVIRGRALRAELVPAYVRGLSREAVFAGRALSSLQVSAREERPEAGANPASAAKPSAPVRFVEFTLNIPLGTRVSMGEEGRLT